MTHTYDESLNCWIIPLSGDIDVFQAPALKQEILDCIAQKQCDILVNATELNYIDSTGLGALVSGLNQARVYGGKITIRGLKGHIKRLFTITALDSIFQFED